MKKKTAALLPSMGLFGMTLLILLFPQQSLSFSLGGLELWFQRMLPALFPFLVLSGLLLRLQLTDTFTALIHPLLFPFFRLSKNCSYVIFIGFLCGFPMGAYVTARLYEQKLLTRAEARLLLAFCNNIGPVYFLSFALPIAGKDARLPALFGMYGLPLLYGLLLRYLRYGRQIPLYRKEAPSLKGEPLLLGTALDDSVMAALTSMAKLGGYMMFFNVWNLLPHLLLSHPVWQGAAFCLLEITGGLSRLGAQAPLLSLTLLPFGGLSCLAQTKSMLTGTDLSLWEYVLHKVVLTVLSFFYYGVLLSGRF